jgi:hypothetical protein
LTIAYDMDATEVAVQAGGWGFGNDFLLDQLYPEGASPPPPAAAAPGPLQMSEYGDDGDFSVALTLESVADNLMGVAGSLLDSVSKSKQFFGPRCALPLKRLHVCATTKIRTPGR